jgi:uncharacterized integral membrane protein
MQIKTKQTSHNSSKKHCSLLLLSFIIFIILFPMEIGNFSTRNEPILIISGLFFLFHFLSNNHQSKEIEYVGFGILTSILFTISTITNGVDDFIFKDFAETIKPIIYSLIFIGGYHYAKHVHTQNINKTIITTTLFMIAFSTLVYLPEATFIMDAYKGRKSYEDWNINYFRFSGTMGFPGIFSYWIVLCFFLIFTIESKKQFTNFFRFTFAISLIVGLILSGARGGIIVFTLVLLLTFIIKLNLKKFIKTIFSLMIFITISIIFLSTLPSETIINLSQVEYLISGFENIQESTAGHRIRELNYLIEHTSIFGNGPSNKYIATHYGPVESVYFYYGYKFGFVGLFLYFTLIIFSIINIRISLKKDHKGFDCNQIFWIWAFCTLTIGALNESVTEEYKSFLFFFFLFGFFSNNKKLNKKTENQLSEKSLNLPIRKQKKTVNLQT